MASKIKHCPLRVFCKGFLTLVVGQGYHPLSMAAGTTVLKPVELLGYRS